MAKRRAEEDYEEEPFHEPQIGSAAFTPYREDLLTEKELREWRKELRERETRRIPVGFRTKP